jgi:ABC-type multidrug transport system ATPase subunit
MQSLLEIAKTNRAIICTVHQPRPEILQLFSKVLLLSRGKIVYFGPATQLVPYFTALGFPCPEHVNPSDYLCMWHSVDIAHGRARAPVH